LKKFYLKKESSIILKKMENFNDAVLQSILGFNESALILLEGCDIKNLNLCILKSNILLNLGRA
jgi:hypothetical protein